MSSLPDNKWQLTSPSLSLCLSVVTITIQGEVFSTTWGSINTPTPAEAISHSPTGGSLPLRSLHSLHSPLSCLRSLLFVLYTSFFIVCLSITDKRVDWLTISHTPSFSHIDILPSHPTTSPSSPSSTSSLSSLIPPHSPSS